VGETESLALTIEEAVQVASASGPSLPLVARLDEAQRTQPRLVATALSLCGPHHLTHFLTRARRRKPQTALDDEHRATALDVP
jgi:hypothetical protein